MASTALQIDALWSGLNDPDTGQSYSGARVAFFEAGTTTPKAVWLDSDKTLPTAAGLAQTTLDSNGVLKVFGDGNYKINIYAPTDTGLLTPLSGSIDGVEYIVGIDPSTIAYDSIADMKAGTGGAEDGSIANVTGYVSSTENQDWQFQWAANSTATDDGGTIIKVTAITTGRWLRLCSDLISPDWFAGNTTPGTTDMSAAIQAAINLVVANTRPPIVFSGEEYYIGSTTLTIPVNGIYLAGNGSIITYDGASTALETGTPGSTRYDCTLDNIVFDTTTAAGGLDALVDLRGLGRLLVQRCRVKTNGNSAIWLGTSAVGDSTIQTTIRDTQLNMEVATGNGIFVDDDNMTLLKIEDCIFNFGDSQIVLANTGGSSASTEINHNTFQNGVISIEVPTSGVKNLAITNNYAELYTDAFVKSASSYTSSNNRISSGGTLIYDISSYMPDIRMSNPDEFTGGATIPIPNFPAANHAINSDMSIWSDDDGSDQIPFGYTAGAFNDVIFSKESTITLIGETSLKVVSAAVNKDIKQRVSRESELVGLRGRRVYMCAWIYTSNASAVRLQIADSAGNSNSVNPLYHPGDGVWQYLVATKVIDSAATFVDFKVRNSIGVSTYYLDSFTWSVDEPVSLYAVSSPADAGYRETSNEISVDLSGAATTKYMLHNTTGNDIYINKATILYTEASSADAGIVLEIGTETDADYFYTGSSETAQSQFSATDLTLLKNVIANGNTIVFTSAGGKAGTGEVKLIIEYLSN